MSSFVERAKRFPNKQVESPRFLGERPLLLLLGWSWSSVAAVASPRLDTPGGQKRSSSQVHSSSVTLVCASFCVASMYSRPLSLEGSMGV
jgi:hypothetical protein